MFFCCDEFKVENDFPESDVDDMRAQMDASLLRYIAAAERKELLLDKMNYPAAGSGHGGRKEDKGEEEEDDGRRSKDRGERGEKKRSSSRKGER